MTNKLVFENLKHRWIRTLLSSMAVGVQVTMILTLVGVSYGTLEDTASRARGVSADILVRPPGSSIIGLSSAPMSEKILDFVAKQPHVVLATGTAVYPIGGINSVTGIDYDKFTQLSGGFKFLSGGPFQSPDDVIVDEYYARQSKVSVGSPLKFMNRTWRVCGIVEPGKLARIFIPLKLLQDLSSNTGKLTVVYVKLDSPQYTDQVIASLKQQLVDYPIYSMGEFVSLISVQNVAGIEEFIYVVIGVSVLAGFLVVFLSMYTAVLERTREIGVLKALGASPGFILNLLVRETVILALIGSLIGILLSFVTRQIIMRYIPGSLQQLIVYDWWPIATGVALVGALLGAMYPGYKAAKQDPIEALSYE